MTTAEIKIQEEFRPADEEKNIKNKWVIKKYFSFCCVL